MLHCDIEIYRDGEIQVVPVKIKNFPSEITIGEYDESLRFIAEHRPDFMNEKDFKKEDITTKQSSEYLHFMIKLVSKFCNEGEAGVLRIPLGEDTTKVEGEAYAATLLSAYEFIIDSINDYVPVPMSHFEHKGQKFRVPTTSVKKLEGKQYGTRMRVIEMVEAMNAYAVFTEQTEEGFTYEDYVKKSIKWVCASLAVRQIDGKDEPECLDLEAHHTRVSERADFFDDLPMDIGLNVRSFFLGLVSS